MEDTKVAQLMYDALRTGEGRFYDEAYKLVWGNDFTEKFARDEVEDALEAISLDGAKHVEQNMHVESDVYTYNLKKWLREEPTAEEWLDEAISSFGWEGCGGNLVGAIGMAQYMAIRSIYYATIKVVKELADTWYEYICFECDHKWITDDPDDCPECGSEDVDWE